MRHNLKKARNDSGKTQKEIAAAIGISTRYYQDLEANLREGKVHIWDALEDLFNIPQRQLRKND